MTMQNNIDIVRRNVRWNMLQPKLQSIALQIDNQRPVGVPVAIPAHHGQRQPDRFEIISDRGFTYIPQMPDFVSVPSEVENCLRQLVMRVCQDENLHSTGSHTTDTTGTKIATLISS